MLSTIITTSLVSLLVLVFLFFAYKDLSLLVRRPSPGLGTGLSRVCAVARTTLLEAWAGRVWLLPLLKLIASLILLLVVRPFDESERIPLYIPVLLCAQEIFLLVMLWVMASISLPRDREMKIIITNASKPLSRLEIMLGKMVGFSAVAALLLAVMTAMTWGILVTADQRTRSAARAEYTLAENDYKARMGKLEAAIPPPEQKKFLAEEGSLFAYNYITVPRDGMSIVGDVITSPEGSTRYLKGGSEEQIIYRFTPRLVAAPGADIAPVGQRPFFWFHFPVRSITGQLPSQVAIQISAVRAKQRLRPQVTTKLLNLKEGGFTSWEPEQPDELFTIDPDVDLGEIEVSIKCPTLGVLLEIFEGQPRDKVTDPLAFNVLAKPNRSVQLVQVPDPNPVVRGFESRDKQQIAGPTGRELRLFGNQTPLEVAVFRFRAQDLNNIPVDKTGHFKLSLLLDIDKQENQELDTTARIAALNEAAIAEPYTHPFTAIEKRTTELSLPATLLGDPDPAKRRDLVVMLRCETPGHWIALTDNSVRIEQPRSPFLLNLIKSEAVIFCEAVLLVVLCVAWSVRLGWPVAMLASATCIGLGYIHAFIAALENTGGLASIGIIKYGELSPSYKFLDKFTLAVWKSLAFIVSLLPDFSRYDYLTSITALRNLPWLNLALDLGWTALYALPFIALGYMMFRKQELG